MNIKTSNALAYLVHLGYLIPFKKLNLYHGRAKPKSETRKWRVFSNFNNAGDATGNRNLNKIPTLYLAEKPVAQQFAKVRANESGAEPEIHKIVAFKDDALLFNKQFNFSKLTKGQKQSLSYAIEDLLVHDVSELSPVKFENRKYYVRTEEYIRKYLKKSRKRFVSYEDINTITQDLKDVPTNLIKQIAGTMNVTELMRTNLYTCIKSFLAYSNRLKSQDENIFPIEWSAIANWLEKYNIIGVKDLIVSATINKTVEAYSIFDEEKINTENFVNQRKQVLNRKFNDFSSVIKDFSKNSIVCKGFEDFSPEEIMKFIKSNPKYKKLYDLDAGLWEGFSIGEHTETTLRVLEDSYKNELPKEMKPFMSVVLLAHDLGKGVAIKNGCSVYLETQNYIQELCNDLKINDKSKKLMEFLILESQNYTTDYYFRKNKDSFNQLIFKSKQVLKETTGEKPTNGMVEALCSLAVILQTCDSGAYTRYGITRDQENNFKYFNGNDRFTASMKEPTDLRRKKQRLIRPNDDELE